MPEDNTNTPALVLMPAAPKRRANKSDLVLLIAELEYEKRKAEADALQAQKDELYMQLLAEAKRVMAKRLANLKPEDFEINVGGYYGGATFRYEFHDNAKMTNLRKMRNDIYVPNVDKADIIKEVRAKMEFRRTDNIKLALKEDPALRKGVEELRAQLFSE